MFSLFDAVLKNVWDKKPLIHCITNYVTVNDCANILLACGASPIMADDAMEVEEISALCNGLALNIGTLNSRTVLSMILAGRKANQLQHPVVLDPVGAGASSLRTRTAKDLIEKVHCTVIRGNSSEIRALSQGTCDTKGVDADAADITTETNLDGAVAAAKAFSQAVNAVIAVTGAIDIVTNGKKTYLIRNGCSMMEKVSGCGCMLTTVIAAYCAANPSQPLEATAAAVSVMGLCGELAFQRMKQQNAGTGTLHIALMDAMSCMDIQTLDRGIKIEER